jgi:hypothetical protein
MDPSGFLDKILSGEDIIDEVIASSKANSLSASAHPSCVLPFFAFTRIVTFQGKVVSSFNLLKSFEAHTA